MTEFWEKVLVGLFCAVVAWIALVSLWGLFYIMPISAVAESTCLKRGYPRTSVDWKGNAYCMNLEGTVSVRLEPLK
jgi:hypothetical protein